MPRCPTESVRFSYTQETVFLICLRLQKLIFSSPRRAKVFICPNRLRIQIPRHRTNAVVDLVTYCQRKGMPYTTFENWSTILSTTKDILSGKASASDVAAKASLGL